MSDFGQTKTVFLGVDKEEGTKDKHQAFSRKVEGLKPEVSVLLYKTLNLVSN